MFGHREFYNGFFDVIINGIHDDMFQRRLFYLNEDLRQGIDDIDYSWFEKLKYTKGLYSIKFPKKKFNNLRFLAMRTKINRQDVIIILEGFYEKGNINQNKGYNKYIKTAEYRMNEYKKCSKGV